MRSNAAVAATMVKMAWPSAEDESGYPRQPPDTKVNVYYYILLRIFETVLTNSVGSIGLGMCI